MGGAHAYAHCVMRPLYRAVMPTDGYLRSMMRRYVILKERHVAIIIVAPPAGAKRNVCTVRMRICRRMRALPRRKPPF